MATFEGPMLSLKNVNAIAHFTDWVIAHVHVGTLGIILYALPMYVAGFVQAEMWKQFAPEGTLVYSFVDTIIEIMPMYWFRAIGGSIYIVGAFVMLYNIIK